MSAGIPFTPTKAEQALLERMGFKIKEPNTSISMIRGDFTNTFRVICFECLTQYDVFGEMKPADTNGDGECTAVQRILEHLANCTGKTRIKTTRIIKHNVDPLWKLTVTWLA